MSGHTCLPCNNNKNFFQIKQMTAGVFRVSVSLAKARKTFAARQEQEISRPGSFPTMQGRIQDFGQGAPAELWPP